MAENTSPRRITLLILGIAMLRGGTEGAFLSFARRLDYDRYDVTLLLAKADGPLLSQLPPQIRVCELGEPFGDMFLLSGANATRTVGRCILRGHPGRVFSVAPYFLRLLTARGDRRAHIATRMWTRMLRYMPQISRGSDGGVRFDGEGQPYDVAAAFWGDRTMFWMCDKVKAEKKLAWLHFDYGNPPREDRLYLDYFNRCDGVITVSRTVDEALRRALPPVAPKCVMIENFREVQRLRAMALEGDGFPDRHFKGKRILSVGRVCPQKGFDMVTEVMSRLRKEERDVRWYIVGGGDENDLRELKASAVSAGVADSLMLLGPSDNPYSLMRDCDLYVQPSRFEGKPITVEEAKILRCPILATDYVSAREQLAVPPEFADKPLKPGEVLIGGVGAVCDISPQGLYNGVCRLLDDSELCGLFAERLARMDFSNEGEMAKFDALTGNSEKKKEGGGNE